MILWTSSAVCHSLIPVVLLVSPMMLQQLQAITSKGWRTINEFATNISAQILAVFLDNFDFVGLFWFRHECRYKEIVSKCQTESCRTHSSTHQNVVPNDFSILNDRQVAKIICVNVDAIIVWKTDRSFEFSRQVMFAVQRLYFISIGTASKTLSCRS